jgi:hypothetical protein
MADYSYDVGGDTSQISLMVDIDTIGLAATRAIVLDLSTTDPAVPVGHSENATGDIKEGNIGTGKQLKGKLLSVLTKIDLIGDAAANKTESERLSGKYYIDGGKDGYIYFDAPVKVIATDFSRVILNMEIDLTT